MLLSPPTPTQESTREKSHFASSLKFNLKPQLKHEQIWSISKDILIPFEEPIKKPFCEGVKDLSPFWGRANSPDVGRHLLAMGIEIPFPFPLLSSGTLKRSPLSSAPEALFLWREPGLRSKAGLGSNPGYLPAVSS